MSTTGFWGLITMFIIVIAFCTSIRKKPTFKTGDICTIDMGAGKYGVIKILAIEPERVHIKVFSNTYIGRPEHVDVQLLTTITFDEAENHATEHVPLEKGDFNKLDAETVGSQGVTREEANTYLAWNG